MFGDHKHLSINDLEERVLKYWQEKNIFEKSVTKKAPKGDYVFYDGPPFATGLPHYGHFLTSFMKDAVPRYQTMKGHRVERRWGWDCHGLPIENQIEEQLGLKTKKDIEKLGVRKFNEAAKNRVLTYAEDWEKIIPRIGRWIEMRNAYKTMDPEYTESVWWVFKSLYDKKLIYEGYKSMHICPRCETTLSNFEVAQGYKNIEDSSVIVEFELEGEKNVYVLAWTTTPWTLPGNVALAINPDIEYVEVTGRVAGNTYILVQSRLEAVFGKEHKIIRNLKGRELIGKKYKPLFDYYSKDKKPENKQNGWKIYGADFAKTDEGTGVVHIAPAFGADDMALGQKYKLPFVQHVEMDGKFKKEVKDFAGLPAKPKNGHQSTDNKIIEWLDKNNKLFKSEKIIHSYPHCWRCDTPLLNYAASSWFVKVTAIKNKKKGLVDNNKRINWVPPHLKAGRFGKILEDAPDWAISRSRYWGAPIPVWQCQTAQNQKSKIKNQKFCGRKIVIGSLQELKDSLSRSGNNYFLMRHGESLSNVKNISSVSLQTGRKHPLTQKGRDEVIRTAKNFKNTKIDLIFSSDLLRAKETSRLVADTIGLPVKKVIFDKRLREVNTGVFDGKNAEKYRTFATLAEKFVINPPKGENLTELKNRVMDFLYEIDGEYKNKNILIVSHEYPIWLMIAGAAGADANKSIALKKDEECQHRLGEYVCPGEMMPLDFRPLPHNHNYELDFHRPYIDKIEFPCPRCSGKMKRVNYVFDCWFESGSMPYGQSHYPFENKERFEKNFPAEFIAEGVDMTRGWFYTLHVLATALFKKPAFKNVVVNGIVLAEDGQKMSKRFKNYPDPMEIVGKYGADALRYYLLSSPVVRAEDLNFSEKGVDEIYKKVILRLINVYNFYEMYAGNARFKTYDLRLKTSNVLDQWILARLKILTSEISKAMDSYELDKASRPIADFIDDLSTWYIRRSRERFKETGKNKEAAMATTRFVLLEFSKMIAPFLPFLADWLYLSLTDAKKSESVHLEKWPVSTKPAKSDRTTIEEMSLARNAASLGLELRAQVGIKVRQPLSTFVVKEKIPKKYMDLMRDELNVKEVITDSKLKIGEGFSWNTGQTAGLDTTITAELKAEGQLRDFVRMVQDLRQKAGLRPQDKIALWLEVPREAEKTLTAQLQEFKTKIGAKSIEFRRAGKFDAEIETQIDGEKICLGIKKI